MKFDYFFDFFWLFSIFMILSFDFFVCLHDVTFEVILILVNLHENHILPKPTALRPLKFGFDPMDMFPMSPSMRRHDV